SSRSRRSSRSSERAATNDDLSRWDRIRRVWPEHSRQVMQRDTGAPPIGCRPEKQPQHHSLHRQTQHRMRSNYSEINQDDDRGNGQAIADDGECPRITGVTREDKTAVRTAFELRPPGKQSPFAAVRTAVAQPAPNRRADQFPARGTQKSICAPMRAMRAGRIDAGWRKTAKLVFSVSTGFALNTLLMSRFTFVRVRPNRRTLPSRRS